MRDIGPLTNTTSTTLDAGHVLVHELPDRVEELCKDGAGLVAREPDHGAPVRKLVPKRQPFLLNQVLE